MASPSRARGPRARSGSLSAAALWAIALVADFAAAAAGARDVEVTPGGSRPAAPDTAALPDARARAAAAAPGVQVLSLEDLHRRENLADALRAVPGFRVRSQAGLGGYAEAWFRGGDARQVAVYLDGVPLGSSLEPAADLGRIPVLMVREMAVDRSGPAAGGDPEGAVAAIRLSTLPLGPAPVTVAGRVSSFGGREAFAALKLGDGASAVHAGAGLQTARNDHPFPTDNGTAYMAGDDGRTAMRNNAFAGAHASLAWSAHGPGGALGVLGLRWDARRKEFPGLYAAASRARGERRELSLHGSWRGPAPGNLPVTLLSGASARWASDAFRDPGSTLGWRSYALERDLLVAAASLGAAARLPGGAHLRLGSRGGYEGAESSEPGGFREYPPPDARRLFVEPHAALTAPLPGGLSARAEGVLSAERLESEAVAGYTGNLSPRPFLRDARGRTLRLALARGEEGGAGVGGGPRLAGLLAEVESVERLPALFEVLGDNNGVQKNMGLAPQGTWGASLEGTLRLGSFRLVGGPFWQVHRAPIRLAPLGASNFLHFANGADYRVLGWESRLDARGPRWRLGQALTASQPEILPGSRLAGNAPAYASALETLTELSFSPLPSLWLDGDLEWRSPYHPDDLNLPGTRRGPEAQAGAGLRWRKRRLEAALRADNLGDRHYRDFAYSPKSGRRWSFRLSMNP